MRYTLTFFILTGTLLLGSCHTNSTEILFADTPSYSSSDNPVKHVVHISVDGLRPDAVTRWIDDLHAFKRLRLEGAFTDNARTSPTRGNTLPNHTSQLTGRVVAGPNGHGWATNRYQDPNLTIHSNRGSYVASIFDVLNEAGLKSALFASKSKFAVFHHSYVDKIDAYMYESSTSKLAERMVDSLTTRSFAYLFLHIRDPDTSGHRFGWRLWSWHPYAWAVRKSDRQITSILRAIDNDPALGGTTAIIVTADHGGHGHSHGPEDRRDYTVPFYVWGPGIPSANLYDLAAHSRADPGEAQIADGAEPQPIRNGDAANLALYLLGLNSIPGSTLGGETPLLRLWTDLPTQPAAN